MYVDKEHGELCIPIYKYSKNDWMRAVATYAQANDYTVQRANSHLLVWKTSEKIFINKDLQFIEALVVKPEYMGDKREIFIGLTPKRLYFQNNSLKPSHEKEMVLFSSKQKPPINVPNIIDGIIDFGNMLAKTREFKQISVARDNDDANIIELTLAKGADSFFSLARDMWLPSLKSGWRMAPEKVNVHFVGDDMHSETITFYNDYKVKLGKKWAQASKNKSHLLTKAWNLKSFLERARYNTTKPAIFSSNDVFVIGITGKQGEALPPMQKELMSILDEWGQQYRLVSLSTQKSAYWLSPHVLSILNAVGTPYSLKLPFPENFNNGAFFGVDIGHDHKKRFSTIVVSVMSPGGRLITSVSQSGRLDESLSGGLISGMLQEAQKLAEGIYGNKFSKAIIIRDGRLANNNKLKTLETTEDYIKCLGIPTTLIELRKNNNPPITRQGESRIAIGANFQPNSKNIRFAVFYDSKIGMANTFKIVLPEDGDVLGWGVDTYVQLLCGLCYSPSLGSQPHLPGPVYWADGFAKTSHVNNKFRGHNVNKT